MISEKVALIGQGLYTDIPNELTLTSMPTASELDYVGSEDFDATMLDKILPNCVDEKVDFHKLLMIDYQWVCRCLRILNYGPYYTTNAIFCDKCHSTSQGEFRVSLNTIECKPLPAGFVNDIVIKADEFLDFNKDIHISLLTVQETLNLEKDKAFQSPETGMINRNLARLCYSIKAIGDEKGLTPIQVKLIIQDKMSPADYTLLKDMYHERTDYGLRAGGVAQCPKCGTKTANFLALMDDRFFRPTVGDLREWKHSRDSREADTVSGGKKKTV